MNRLWVRLTLAFALVLLIGISVVALLADVAVGREFRGFIARNEVDPEGSGLVSNLVAYFDARGSWVGVDAVMAKITSRWRRGLGPDASRFGPEVLIADAGGSIVYDSHGLRVNESLSGAEREAAMLLQLQGRMIGYFTIVDLPPGALRPEEINFIDRARQNLIVAALLAGGVAIVLGVAFSRSLAGPLNRLAVAARAIAAHDLTHRVELRGTAEVVEVGHAFNDMAVSLEKAEELRRNLVADVAHELRTPLSVLQGNLSGLLDGVFPLEMDEIARLYDETRLLGRLVEDLRELAQAEAGQLRLDLRPTQLADVARAIVEAFSVSAAELQVSLTAETPADVHPVQADSERVTQVLGNLLSNALRHTPPGGEVHVKVFDAPGAVEVSVSDTGEGIAAEDVPHVFDRFWRSDRSRARETGGSGLGLAIARRLIEVQGGRIGVESKPGQGSRFWFRLPFA